MRFFRLLVVIGLLASPLAAVAESVPQSREQIKLSFAPVVKQVEPAVVNIYTRKVVRNASPMFADPFFRQFFGNRLGIPQERVQQSLGSGVIVKPDGVVVTNNHVIRDSDQITVVLADRREFEAKVLGADERTDLAVLKIDAGRESLPVLPMGDSDTLEVGDVVLAVGNPFGVGQTVTMGIVSALARTSVGISDFRSFIQTDAAINPGNSGGPLVDLQGRLVGINSAIVSPGEGGGSIGIGFAIPVAMVKAVLTSITSGGKAVRPWLGASGQAVTADMFQALHLPRPAGVLINEVHPDGPAERAGLKVGDVVIAIDGREVEDPDALKFRVATLAAGAQAQLAIIRNGQEQTLSIRLTAPPEIPPRDTTEFRGQSPFTGATVANLNPALADELGLPNTAKGVVILGVANRSIAQSLQFQPGDIILKVNGRALAAVSDLRFVLEHDLRDWTIVLRRAGEVVTLRLGG
jgi:serine protease Do